MSKKILAGVLAAASILSVSAVASAESAASTTAAYNTSNPAPANGVSYDVSADVSYGTVDCVLPAASVLAKNSVVVNPYGAAVKSEKKDATKLTNTSFIASPYYMVLNNDTEGGLKVIATCSVKKATGLVIVDGNAEKPAGFDDAVDKNGDSVRVSGEGISPNAANFHPLVSYDKISAKTDKTSGDTTYTGGALSTKQAMNTAVYLVGGTDTDKIAAAAADATAAEDATFRVDFAAKGTTGGTIMWIPKATNASAPGEGYFTVMGELNPEIDKEAYSWGKENLSLSIVLKLVPTVPATAAP